MAGGNMTFIAGNELNLTAEKILIHATDGNITFNGAKGMDIQSKDGISYDKYESEDNKEEKPPMCDECGKAFAIAQIKAMKTNMTKEQIAYAEACLPYLNKYREKYKLDTCLRKALFIAQVMTETDGFRISAESGDYGPLALGSFAHDGTRFFKNALLADYFIKPVKDKTKSFGYFSEAELNDLIKVEYVDPKKEPKQSIKELLQKAQYNTTTVDQKDLYGRMKDSKTKKINDKILYEDKELKIILKKHDAFQVKIFSRAYGDWMGNAKEMDDKGNLTHEGYLFRGQGLFQLTGKEDYIKLSEYRRNFPFPDDTTGYINFTTVTDKEKNEGEFTKLADKTNPIYGVQSAVWEWAISKESALFSKEAYADKDDVVGVSKTINGGYNGLDKRSMYSNAARKDAAFKVYKHYKSVFDNTTEESVKKKIIDNLKLITKARIIGNDKVIVVDDNKEAVNDTQTIAEKLLRTLEEAISKPENKNDPTNAKKNKG